MEYRDADAASAFAMSRNAYRVGRICATILQIWQGGEDLATCYRITHGLQIGVTGKYSDSMGDFALIIIIIT